MRAMKWLVMVCLISATMAASTAVAQVLPKSNAKIDSMLQYFQTFKLDDGSIEFRHNNLAFSWLNETGLYIAVKLDGHYDLISVYSGDERIYHDRAVLVVDTDTLQTRRMPETDPAYRYEPLGEVGVRESIRFNDADGIVSKIAKNTRKTITVFLEGKDYVDDAELELSIKQGFRDSYLLGQELRKLNSGK